MDNGGALSLINFLLPMFFILENCMLPVPIKNKIN